MRSERATAFAPREWTKTAGPTCIPVNTASHRVGGRVEMAVPRIACHLLSNVRAHVLHKRNLHAARRCSRASFPMCMSLMTHASQTQ